MFLKIFCVELISESQFAQPECSVPVINSDHLPPPFRHLSGGNGGTCCADVGQNFGVLAWWTQPPKPQCWKQVPNYVSDISVLTLWFGWLGPSVIVFGFLFWLCPGCGWGDGKGEVQAKTPLLCIIFVIIYNLHILFLYYNYPPRAIFTYKHCLDLLDCFGAHFVQ